ncbi:MAG: UvrD-helicase domain-containing protein [Gammaproteobacteria bacterium]|uniref:DNA 3'-5' helicase n=1 Tax=Candidatus Thiopontia autotrophica TaxID=2841688 RepID=A0A8J6TSY1_9GAMM|nr:UvrD-helicase domain-containing protein [Candidatus Thiopontia autotrophica]MBL6969608.1 UvrD-helicase domain-containing protein [Gammaproteobacteria bacterium]
MQSIEMEEERTVREEVLNPELSAIVQAPAGSGKTELLIQRFLSLLAGVKEPEEILAITFTRKAAGEMRTRLLDSLMMAASRRSPAEPHKAVTWRLASEVLKRDSERGWKLLTNPGRLEIRTMDSLNAKLVRQMPVMAAFGGVPGISDDAEEAFSGAARRTIQHLEKKDRAAVAQLLAWLDNDVGQLERMLTDMLGHRDQWLPHVAAGVGGVVDRDSLEQTLCTAVEQSLQNARNGLLRVLGESGVDQLVTLAASAAEVVNSGANNQPVSACAAMDRLPEADAFSLPQWQGIASLFLKGGEKFRVSKNSWNKNNGFPPGAAGGKLKQLMLSLLQTVESDHEAAVAIQQIPLLPPVRYEDSQWETITSLFQVLLIAQIELMGWFEEKGVVDHNEIARRALQALGSEAEPTNLALRLDYQIHHILVDEFQDTSHGQFDLLSRLTAEWSNEDKDRTLFLVGDPMQSIYRFRHAEVGLFIKAIKDGVGGLQLEYKKLLANFRSEEGVVRWINQSFSTIFPAHSDRFSGAIHYSESISTRPQPAERSVVVHPSLLADYEAEASKVVELVREEIPLLQESGDKIAILVRSRSHLNQITWQLYSAGVAYNAVEIESLGDRPVVRDLLALTRALFHQADREAWLAILRAPWSGISLQDLLSLTAGAADRTIWSLLFDDSRLEQLSAIGAERVRWLRNMLESVFAERGEAVVDLWVERAWVLLGGAAIHEQMGVAGQAERESASFFDLLGRMSEGGELTDFDYLREQLNRQTVRSGADPDSRVEVMTIHKSKGLEFDTVILPGLGRKPRGDQQKLLHWLEIPGVGENSAESMQLLLSPVRPAEQGSDEDRLGRYVRKVEQSRERNELSRLLYVATTRARRKLHLLGASKIDSEGELGRPQSGSLLEQLWPVVKSKYEQLFDSGVVDLESAKNRKMVIQGSARPQRISTIWEQPHPPAATPSAGQQTFESERVVYQWAAASAVHVGTVVHAILQWIADAGVESWRDSDKLRSVRKRAENQLRQLGVASETMVEAADKVMEALRLVLEDDKGCYLLSDHAEAKSEWSLSARIGDERFNITIDRTFVDEDGVRWIVDWKTSSHSGGNLDGFLDEEVARYTPQLQRYGKVLQQMEDRPQKLVLYFPMHQVVRVVA